MDRLGEKMRRIVIGNIQIAWWPGQVYIDHRFPTGWRLDVQRGSWLPFSVREGWAPQPKFLLRRPGWQVAFYGATYTLRTPR